MAAFNPFAALVPAIMLVLGTVLVTASRWGSRPAVFWGVGLMLSAAGFTASLLPLPHPVQAMFADALFLLAFFLYGHGLLVRFRRPRLVLQRALFAITVYLAIGVAVLGADSLRAELLLSDIACAILLLWPLAVVGRHLDHTIDRMLAGVIGLVALESLVRVALLGSLIAADSRIDDYIWSPYAFWVQASAAIIAILFSMTVLGTVAVDIIAVYRDAAERDALTGLLNRRGFARVAENTSSDARFAAVVHCDIDHFKRVNDAHGHAAGDSILAGFAALLMDRLPAGGAAARFGGEEFVLLLPDLGPNQAAALAERMRDDLANRDWQDFGMTQKITASFGVATFDRRTGTIDEAIVRADAALYAAKSKGRNQVMLDETATSVLPAGRSA